jgi:ATP-dependent DNA helicase RecG
MNAMEKYTNGFDIADEDLRIRGPGELLGDEQSGSLAFLKLASLADDKLLADSARELAHLQVLRAGDGELPPVLRYALKSRTP